MGIVSEVSESNITGESAEFTLRYAGCEGKSAGNWLRAALIAASTSRAAALMSRFRSNCSVIPVLPSVEVEVICVTPAMRPNWRSSGVATAEAIVSGLAPGRLAPTEIVGRSTCGSGATGRKRKAIAPDRKMAMVTSDVATGRRIKGAEKLNSKFTLRLRPEALRPDWQHRDSDAVRASRTQDTRPASYRASGAG